MFRKILIVFLSVTLVFNLFVFKEVKGAVPVVIKAVGGELLEQSLISMGERAGMALSGGDVSAKEKAIKAWNLREYQLAQSLDAEIKAEYNSTINKMSNRNNIVPIPEKPNFGKIAVSAVGFLTGVSMIYDTYKAIEKGYNEGVLVDTISEIDRGLSSGEYAVSYGDKVYIEPYDFYGEVRYRGFYPYGSNSVPAGNSKSYDADAPSRGYINERSRKEDGISFEFRAYGMIGGKPYSEIINSVFVSFDSLAGSNVTGYYQPTSGEVPSFDGIPKPIRDILENPDFDINDIPDHIPDSFPKEIEIIVPLDETGLTSEPYSEPLTAKDLVPDGDTNPDPDGDTNPDPDGDTNPDPDGDTNPDPDGGDGGDGGGDKPDPKDRTHETSSIDWKKLLTALGGFTYVFPFSIPWDIGRAVDAVFGGFSEGLPPEWEINLVGMEFTLKIPDVFLSWVPITRTFLVFIFDIGVIYALRKWFGGAT